MQSHIYQQGRLVYNYLTNFWKLSHLLNGTGATAGDWVQALERLTLRNDLSLLTLLCWSEVLPAVRLLRRTRAWCPACYEEWRKANQIAYEPLLWSLEVVKVCCRHQIPLQQRCPSPSCRQAQLPLAPRSLPGYCAKCNSWLGSEAQKEAFVYKTSLFSNITTAPLLSQGINSAADLTNPAYNYFNS